MARLLSVLLLALVMSAWQKNNCCVAQTVEQGLGYKTEGKSQAGEEQQYASFSFFKLSSLLPGFMKGERPRPTEERDRSKNQSPLGASASTSSSENYAERKEPISAAFPKMPSQENSYFPETSAASTSLNQQSDYTEKMTHASSLSDPTSIGTFRHTGTELHQIPERPVSFSYGAGSTRDFDRVGGEGRDLYLSSSRQSQTSMTNMPARGRLVLSRQSASKGDQPARESGNSQVLMKIQEFAEKSYSSSSKGGVIRIGDTEIPKEKVTAVGDVDGNKVTDYIVSNVAAKNYSGTIRLYLMGEGDSFLYTRELIPGKWGFEHPELSVGDRFGSTVFRLLSTGSSSQCFVAITAPGDRSTKDENGSVYILEVSERGNVINHKKLSATEFLELMEEQQKEERTRRNASTKPLQTTRPQTSRLQHLDGISSMLFINATGRVQAVLNVKASKHKELLKQIEAHLTEENESKKTLSAEMEGSSSSVGRDDSCLFSKRECACKLEASHGSNNECFDVFQSKEKHGTVICLKRACPPAYKCSCEGKEKCRRVEEVDEIYIPDHRGERGELYCTFEKRLVPKTVPLPQT